MLLDFHTRQQRMWILVLLMLLACAPARYPLMYGRGLNYMAREVFRMP